MFKVGRLKGFWEVEQYDLNLESVSDTLEQRETGAICQQLH